MKCKELWSNYLEHLSLKAAYDFILSCKICLPLIVTFYTIIFFMKYLPEIGITSIGVKGFLSIIFGVGVSVFTMPLLIIGIVGIGILVRFIRDFKNGTCALCTWLKGKIGLTQ